MDLKFFDEYYYRKVHAKVDTDERTWPPMHLRYRALERVPVDDVKVVFICSHPYSNRYYEHGLAISVPSNIKRPPAQVANLIKEYKRDLGYDHPRSYNLDPWTERGIVLLNTVLTMVPGNNVAHKDKGWEYLAYSLIKYLTLNPRQKIVYVLIGQDAQRFLPAFEKGHTDYMVMCYDNLSTRGEYENSHQVEGSGLFTSIATYLEVPKSFWKLP